MFRSIAATIAAIVLTLGVAGPAAADIPLVRDNPVVDVSGNRANGFTLTFQSGGTWVTGSLHEELAACRGQYAKGSQSRRKCAGIVRGWMREYVAIRAAG